MTVLRSQYATELAAIADTDLYLPAPEDTAYKLVGREVEILTRRVNFPVVVFYWALSPRITVKRYTEGPLVHRALTTLPIAVEVHARIAPQDNFVATGQVFDPDQVELWRAERYVGALIETIYKHLGNQNDSLDALLTRDEARLDSGTSERPFAVARTEWLVTQDVTIPNPDYVTV